MANDVTRVRVEVTGLEKRDVDAKFLSLIEDMGNLYARPWEIESSNIIPTKTGYWGYITLVRPHIRRLQG